MKFRTYEKYPLLYAETMRDLGIAYAGLSKIKDEEENSKLALMCFDEALRVYTLEDDEWDYIQIVEYKNLLK